MTYFAAVVPAILLAGVIALIVLELVPTRDEPPGLEDWKSRR